MKRTGYLVVVGGACAAALSIGGCGGDDEKADTPAATQAAAPESQFAPDSEVTSGLKELVGVSEKVSQQQGAAASKKVSEGLEPVWKPVEGTVKRNEPDMYATIEEDLSLLESGDAKKTQLGAEEMSKIVDSYLAKHPG